MVDGDFKDLARKTIADKVLRDKVFNFAKNPKNNAYQRGLSSMFYKFFDKKLLVKQLKMKIFLVKKKLKNYTNKSLEHLIKKSRLTFYRKHLGSRSCRYEVDKQI